MSLDTAARSPLLFSMVGWIQKFWLNDLNCIGSPRNWLDVRRADELGTGWERR